MDTLSTATAQIQILPTPKKKLLDRILSVVTVVEAGEGAGSLLMAGNLFIVLASYYLLKTVRESLILTQGGAEVKSYAAAGQALLLLLLVPAYGAFASKVNCALLIAGVTLFFVSHLAIFAALGLSGAAIGVPFYLWVGIFNVFVIAQFWAFANDVYTHQQGKRLFPIVGVGSALGAWLGAHGAASLFPRLGPYGLMVLAAFLLCVSLLLTYQTQKKVVGPSPSATRKQCPLGEEGGFQLVFRDRYLLLIALLILFLNVVNTTGEFLLSKLVVEAAERVAGTHSQGQAAKQAFIGEFYGSFFGWVNLLGLLFQVFLVSRVLKRLCVCGALLILPAIALGGYGLLAMIPLLSVVQIAKVLENSADYSIQNTARHALFLPTSREAKYKGKMAIDTFFWRAGDLLQAGLVFLGSRLAFTVSDYAAVNLVLVLLWLLIIAYISREHRRLAFCY